jgi:hypothetical protein
MAKGKSQISNGPEQTLPNGECQMRKPFEICHLKFFLCFRLFALLGRSDGPRQHGSQLVGFVDKT